MIDRIGPYQGDLDLNGSEENSIDQSSVEATGTVADTLTASLPARRTRLQLEGMVQGVGFRPFVSHLALQLGLAGWVANSGDGVTAEVEGAAEVIEVFLERLAGELPPLARIDRLHTSEKAVAGESGFSIRESTGFGRAHRTRVARRRCVS